MNGLRYLDSDGTKKLMSLIEAESEKKINVKDGVRIIDGKAEIEGYNIIFSPFRLGIDSDGNCGFIKPGESTVTPFGSGGKSFDTIKVAKGMIVIDEDAMLLIKRQQGTTEETIPLPSVNDIFLGLTNTGNQLVCCLRYDRENDILVDDPYISSKIFKANSSEYSRGMNIVSTRITKTADKTYELYWILGANYGTVWVSFNDTDMTSRNSWGTNSCDIFKYANKE